MWVLEINWHESCHLLNTQSYRTKGIPCLKCIPREGSCSGTEEAGGNDAFEMSVAVGVESELTEMRRGLTHRKENRILLRIPGVPQLTCSLGSFSYEQYGVVLLFVHKDVQVELIAFFCPVLSRLQHIQQVCHSTAHAHQPVALPQPALATIPGQPSQLSRVETSWSMLQIFLESF